MARFTRVEQLVDELKRKLEQLGQEIAQLKGTEEGASGLRSLAAGQDDEEEIFDSSNVIPPTRTDAPDSIVGGTPTSQFPDCCAVGDEVDYFCSGTLIAPNVVVTAEHCTNPKRVFLKGRDVSKPESGETINVKKSFSHPEVDLQVLVLEQDSTVKPRHIAQSAEVQGTQVTLVGFGTVDFDGTKGFGQKRRVTVPISSIDCGSAEDAAEFGCQIGKEMVAGHRGLLRDSCRGDSGGPAYIRTPLGGLALAGVTSRGIRNTEKVCGDGGIYVRVDKFIDWIREKTGVDIPGPQV